MISDVHNLIDDLGNVLARIAESIEESKPLIITRKSSSMGFDITANLSIRLGILESLTQDYRQQIIEPLVDVFEDDDSIKVIALIPGIKKEDIETLVHDGAISIHIRKGDQIIHKNIPCSVLPSQVSIKSLRYNNSVLEIVFDKRKK